MRAGRTSRLLEYPKPQLHLSLSFVLILKRKAEFGLYYHVGPCLIPFFPYEIIWLWFIYLFSCSIVILDPSDWGFDGTPMAQSQNSSTRSDHRTRDGKYKRRLPMASWMKINQTTRVIFFPFRMVNGPPRDRCPFQFESFSSPIFSLTP